MTVRELFKDNLTYNSALNINIIEGNTVLKFLNSKEVLNANKSVLNLIVEHSMTIDGAYCVFCIDSNKLPKIKTVRDLLTEYKQRYTGEKYVEVYQRPIEDIDHCKSLVRRYSGSIDISLGSNQNYLDFEVEDYIDEGDRFTIICFANKGQEQRIINAYKRK